MPAIAGTDLDVFGLSLGGNVFGWTADEPASFAVLDAYAAAGGNSIDTADVYPVWAPGCSGGESETIIGRWLASRGNRDQMIIATKVCAHPDFRGLSAANIRAAAEASLRRLGTDRIDLYYAHYDDPKTPVEETVEAFDSLVRAGKVRYLGASNFGPERLTESLDVAHQAGLARYVALQPLYNLVEREYEQTLAPIASREKLACLPYAALASGFLTGKYRPHTTVDSPRAEQASAYLKGGGADVVGLLGEIAAGHGVSSAAVALAWLAAQPTVVSPIASARTPEQLAEFLPFASLSLSSGELDALAKSSTVAGTDGP
jgi:aryl-alcohol dehydrogenase-like predicted oxidoreductase